MKDAQELLALQNQPVPALAEKTAAYSRHLYDIASGTGAEFSQAFEAKTADAQKGLHQLGGQRCKERPAGSRNHFVAMMKSTVSAANNAFESVQKAVKQTSDMAEANFNAVTNTAVNAAKTAAPRKR